ncbi:hypothetical protein B5K11_20000 [Rhizobium leguminosarum bv. trifolii]|uniref:hypothetical protein n=1 Tax=Rhizobium leguminosarum TaxID=384 RepID=UPI000E2E76AE|nr:hypothetical protein [Rhizobium leguminosarum]RFB90339.1 hypothetical protein B5K11_20000 [Rhizobium leguminosarum bv. trifolii]
MQFSQKSVSTSISLPPVIQAKPALNNEIAPTYQPPSPKAPLSASTVKRVLKQAHKNKEMAGFHSPFTWAWESLSDHTSVALVEHISTSVRYHWTISPDTFKPQNLGPVDA